MKKFDVSAEYASAAAPSLPEKRRQALLSLFAFGTRRFRCSVLASGLTRLARAIRRRVLSGKSLRLLLLRSSRHRLAKLVLLAIIVQHVTSEMPIGVLVLFPLQRRLHLVRRE